MVVQPGVICAPFESMDCGRNLANHERHKLFIPTILQSSHPCREVYAQRLRQLKNTRASPNFQGQSNARRQCIRQKKVDLLQDGFVEVKRYRVSSAIDHRRGSRAVVPAETTGQDEGTVGAQGNVNYSINGGRVENNNWEIDGGNVRDNGSNETLNVYPSIEAIDEVQLLTSNYGASCNAPLLIS